MSKVVKYISPNLMITVENFLKHPLGLRIVLMIADVRETSSTGCVALPSLAELHCRRITAAQQHAHPLALLGLIPLR